MTSNEEIAEVAGQYLPWLEVGPFLAVWAFLFDGFFVGATLSEEMMIARLPMFAGDGSVFHVFDGLQLFKRKNDQLWCCFYAFMVYRSFFQWLLFDKLISKAQRGLG